MYVTPQSLGNVCFGRKKRKCFGINGRAVQLFGFLIGFSISTIMHRFLDNVANVCRIIWFYLIFVLTNLPLFSSFSFLQVGEVPAEPFRDIPIADEVAPLDISELRNRFRRILSIVSISDDNEPCVSGSGMESVRLMEGLHAVKDDVLVIRLPTEHASDLCVMRPFDWMTGSGYSIYFNGLEFLAQVTPVPSPSMGGAVDHAFQVVLDDAAQEWRALLMVEEIATVTHAVDGITVTLADSGSVLGIGSQEFKVQLIEGCTMVSRFHTFSIKDRSLMILRAMDVGEFWMV